MKCSCLSFSFLDSHSWFVLKQLFWYSFHFLKVNVMTVSSSIRGCYHLWPDGGSVCCIAVLGYFTTSMTVFYFEYYHKKNPQNCKIQLNKWTQPSHPARFHTFKLLILFPQMSVFQLVNVTSGISTPASVAWLMVHIYATLQWFIYLFVQMTKPLRAGCVHAAACTCRGNAHLRTRGPGPSSPLIGWDTLNETVCICAAMKTLTSMHVCLASSFLPQRTTFPWD